MQVSTWISNLQEKLTQEIQWSGKTWTRWSHVTSREVIQPRHPKGGDSTTSQSTVPSEIPAISFRETAEADATPLNFHRITIVHFKLCLLFWWNFIHSDFMRLFISTYYLTLPSVAEKSLSLPNPLSPEANSLQITPHSQSLTLNILYLVWKKWLGL